jgi:hypothetical protein
MPTVLTSIFGTEINVFNQPRLAEIAFVGFPGAHGVVGMNLGTRGMPFVITGKLRGTGANYDASRKDVDEWISQIETLLLPETGAQDYTYHGTTYSQVQFTKFDLIPDGQGKLYHMTSSEVIVNFIMRGHILE